MFNGPETDAASNRSMALAAAVAPQSSLLVEPSWGETIVPTLRQRLQQESRALTKRLSQHSIISGDDSHSPRRPSLGSRVVYGRSVPEVDRAVSPNQQRPSAIPRPSMQYDRQPPQSAKKPAVTRPPQQRARTQSTPYRYDPASPEPSDPPLQPPLPPNGMPTPASSRAASPFNANGMGSTPARPSRIPMVAPTRQRSGSHSSHGNSSTGHGGGGKPNGRPPPSPPETSLDLFPVMESPVVSLSNKPTAIDQPQIRDEKPPYDSAALARVSNESLGERPVQHWYRGDTSRNGGVGEIRVVNRKEMLAIATFGHQHAPSRPLSGVGATLMAKHRRAGSMEGKRGSWLIDDQAIAGVGRVMDEEPLTDLEDGTDAEASSTGHHHQQQQQQWQQQEQQQEPLPQRPAPVVAPAPAPTPAPVPMTPKKTPGPRPPVTPQSKATSPAASSSRVAQQKRGKARPPAQKKKIPTTPARPEPLTEENGLYGDEYSIPFSQPTPARVSNWDDVVLPAVSKRMGIEGYGVKSEDGIIALKATPKASRDSIRYEPAPGTFGYDASKAQKRDPREQGDISEFGRTPKKIEGAPEASPMPTPTPSPRRPIRRLPSNLDDRPPSPAPFSDYPPVPSTPSATPGKGTPRKRGEVLPMVHPPSPNGHHVEKVMVEPEGAGCCKCVIM